MVRGKLSKISATTQTHTNRGTRPPQNTTQIITAVYVMMLSPAGC